MAVSLFFAIFANVSNYSTNHRLLIGLFAIIQSDFAIQLSLPADEGGKKRLTKLMNLRLNIIIALLAATFTMSAAKPASAGKTTPKQSVTVAEVDDEDMHLASVSATNPFEIVPAAGMEMLAGFTTAEEDMEIVSDLLGYARKYIGTRYVRGGKTPRGFDCSGFTSYVFRQFGIDLSASSSVQYGQGKKISRDEIQPGDLVFFTGRASRSGSVGHVGIAIDADPATGEITFIHASTSSGVKIDKVSAPYYAKRFLGARRVIGN